MVHGTTLPFVGNMPQMQQPMKDVLKSTSTAIFSTAPKQARALGSSIPTNIVLISSICTAGLVVVHRLGELADLL